jgi:hypothetical protein
VLVARITQDGEDESAALAQNLVLEDVTCTFRDICNRLSWRSISRTRSYLRKPQLTLCEDVLVECGLRCVLHFSNPRRL